MNTTRKVVLASACGAAIGYAVASQLLHGWLFVGIIVGAVAGWFLYDPAQFFASVKGAVVWVNKDYFKDGVWKAPSNQKIIRRSVSNALEETFSYGQIVGSIIGYVAGIFVTLLMVVDGNFSLLSVEALLNVFYVAMLFVALVTLLIGLLFSLEFFKIFNRRKAQHVLDGWSAYLDKRSSEEVFDWKDTLKFNIITVPFIGTALSILLVLWLVFRGIPFLLRFIMLVAITTFRLAHSNGRLASAVGGALGALVGLWAGYLVAAMLVGAVAGGIAHYLGQFCSAEYVEQLKANLTGKKSNA